MILNKLNCFQFLIGVMMLVFCHSLAIHAQTGANTEEFYIAAKNGLIVRSKPNSEAERVKKIHFNEKIIVVKVDVIDTIENRISNWYSIDGMSNQYVFGGYLNKYILPDTIDGILNNYIGKFAERFGELKSLAYDIIPLNDNKGKGLISFSNNDKVSIIVNSGYEYSKVEYYFKNISINEFINIFDLMKVYDGFEETILVPKFENEKFLKFSYSIPEAGMDTNEVIKINETDVLIRFVFSL